MSRYPAIELPLPEEYPLRNAEPPPARTKEICIGMERLKLGYEYKKKKVSKGRGAGVQTSRLFSEMINDDSLRQVVEIRDLFRS
jgi:hypothetical protein